MSANTSTFNYQQPHGTGSNAFNNSAPFGSVPNAQPIGKNSKGVVSIGKPSRLRFWIGSLAVLLLTLVVVLVGRFFVGNLYNSLTAQTASSQQDMKSEPYPRLAKQLETDLQNVLDPSFTWQAATISDPFTDRAGLSGEKINAALYTPPPQPMPQIQRPQPTNYNGGLAVNNQVTNNAQDETAKKEASIAATKERLQNREKTRSQGSAVPPLSSVLNFDDCYPLGLVGDEKSGRQVMFYSPIAKRTFSAPVGARFYDATLIELSSEGVVFRDDKGKTYTKGWTKYGDVEKSGGQSNNTPVQSAPRTSGSNKPSGGARFDDLQEAVKERYKRPNP